MRTVTLCLFVWAIRANGPASVKALPAEESPVVTISQGSLRGTTATTPDKTNYYRFLGIPYAKPPVGFLRFKAPQAPENWKGVRNATTYGSNCKQRKVTTSEEDCLFLNVFTPKLPTGSNPTLLPTMVRIHGGAFVAGSGDINPGHLMDLGVVVVAINYRLGVFGFLALEDTDVGGNAGLKDQAAALRWVKDNIAKFGGDPHKVTIFGQSAGGASVHYQVLSPTTAGLFRAAISESGSAFDPWAFRENIDILTKRLGSRIGLNWTTNQQLVDALRTNASSDDLLSISSLILTGNEQSMYITETFGPTMDHPVKGETVFLPQHPVDIEKSGTFNKVPYITGTNKMEAGSFVGSETAMKNSSYWNKINSHLERIVPAELGLKRGSAASEAMTAKIKDFYFPNKTMAYETRQNWIDLQTDYQFAVGDQRRLLHHIQHVNDTYSYQYSYGWSVHSAETRYILCNEPSAKRALCQILGETWTNFAKYLNPSTSSVKWTPVTKNSRQYVNFDNQTTLVHGTKDEKRMEFWRTQVYGSKY